MFCCAVYSMRDLIIAYGRLDSGSRSGSLQSTLWGGMNCIVYCVKCSPPQFTSLHLTLIKSLEEINAMRQ